MADTEARLQRTPEVDIELASKWLGLTTKTLIEYLRSKQIEGVKVAETWFVKSESLLSIRPAGTPLKDLLLPVLENPFYNILCDRLLESFY